MGKILERKSGWPLLCSIELLLERLWKLVSDKIGKKVIVTFYLTILELS